MKFSKERILVWIVCVCAILGGFQVLIFGKIGSTTGSGHFEFKGIERLVALIPISIASFFIWAISLPDKKLAEKNEDKD